MPTPLPQQNPQQSALPQSALPKSAGSEAPTPTPSRNLGLYLVLGLGLAAVVALSLLLGAGDLADPRLGQVFLELRLARLSAALLAGVALSIGGVMVQGLFQNPLASPSILGTTAGATLGGQMTLLAQQALLSQSVVAGGSLAFVGALSRELLLPLGCLAGALCSLLVLLAFLRRGVDLLTLLLTGFMLSALFLSVGSFLTSIAQEGHELGRAVLAFTLGGLGGVGWPLVWMALPLVMLSGLAAWLWSRPLDLLLCGDEEATSLGLDVLQSRRWIVIWVSILTAAAVSLGGNVGFVGLLAPHAMRPIVGAEHRKLLPAAALTGALFVAGSDLLTRVLPTQTPIPLGVITGLLGAPLFLMLLLRMRSEDADA